MLAFQGGLILRDVGLQRAFNVFIDCQPCERPSNENSWRNEFFTSKPVLTFSTRLLGKQVYTNAFQRVDRPYRILILFPVVQIAKEVLDKLWVSILHDGLSRFPHQV